MRKLFLKRKKTLDESLINLTPLIDVVFVVLIAFIIIAPLLEIDRVELVKVKKKSSFLSSEKDKISIYVRKDNSIWINNSLSFKHSTSTIKCTILTY